MLSCNPKPKKYTKIVDRQQSIVDSHPKLTTADWGLPTFIMQKQPMKSTLSKFYTIETGTNNEILRRKSEKITKIDEDLINLGNDMIDLMYENDGVGLAAPQIGKNIRMIAVTSRKETKKGQELASETIMINPEIIEKSNEMVIGKEACLSVPDVEGYVKRHKNITVEYTSLDGHRKTKKLKDYNAVIIQHEVDHLDGILFVDKLEKNYKEKKKSH